MRLKVVRYLRSIKIPYLFQNMYRCVFLLDVIFWLKFYVVEIDLVPNWKFGVKNEKRGGKGWSRVKIHHGKKNLKLTVRKEIH